MYTIKKIGIILLILILAGYGLIGSAFAGTVSAQNQHDGDGYSWVSYQYDNTSFGGPTHAYAKAQSGSVGTYGGNYPISQIRVSAHVDEYILGEFDREIDVGTQTLYNSPIAIVDTTYTAFFLDQFVMTSNHYYKLDGVEEWTSPVLQTSTYGL